jgi:serine/threonine protein phosphatase PrpC
MGGHAAGEVASAIAGNVILRNYYDVNGSPDAALELSFRRANAAIHQEGKAHAERQGMGTTCTAVAIPDGRAWLAHVGDSRCYLLRGGDLRQLSEDHSLVNNLVRAGVITSEEAHTRSDRNVILRALGTQPKVEVTVWREGLPLSDGDVLLLCSDGLSDYVDDKSITSILLTEPQLEACRALIAAALAAGSDNNISVGVFTLSAEPPSTSRPIGDTRTIRVD